VGVLRGSSLSRRSLSLRGRIRKTFLEIDFRDFKRQSRGEEKIEKEFQWQVK
jgi:hypothetical protein